MRIAVLTSGGDASGMNTALCSIYEKAVQEGITVLGIKNGYNGLLDNEFVILNQEMLEHFNKGGSFLKSLRSSRFATKEGVARAVQVLKNNKIDCLIVIGGNGSLRGAYDLMQAGANVMFIPASIDNDLGYTKYSLGFDTAVQNAITAVFDMKMSFDASERGLIVECMGNTCSDIAVHTALCTRADVLITKKHTPSRVVSVVNDLVKKGIKSPLIVVQEKLFDVKNLARILEENTGVEFRSVVLGYLQRGGNPTHNEILRASLMGAKAVNLALKKKFNRALGINNDGVIDVSLKTAIITTKHNEEKIYKYFVG